MIDQLPDIDFPEVGCRDCDTPSELVRYQGKVYCHHHAQTRANTEYRTLYNKLLSICREYNTEEARIIENKLKHIMGDHSL